MNNKRDDYFDKMESIPALKNTVPYLKKYQQGILYLFFGGATFLIGLAVYILLWRIFGLNELFANIISWVAGVTFAFFSNQKWVFGAKSSQLKENLQQAMMFFVVRIITLILQESMLYIAIMVLGINSIASKIITDVVIIVLNYLLSKFIIFGKKYKGAK